MEDFMFIKQVEVSPMVVFAYVVGDPASGKALVIDPAADADYLIGLAQDNGMHIDYIVNTHGHVDHISGNKEMKDKTGASIIIHELDAPMLGKTPPVMLRMFGATDRRKNASHVS